ncbi:MAG TPA: hypothetical protein VM616_06240 [Gammaproteobacteria bacterium]|nr:hypothetical protein [Gammaproteobacteria bacterium]
MNRRADSAATLRRLDTLFDSPELFLASLDLGADRVRLTPMTAASYARSPFLDRRIERAGRGDLGMSLAQLVEAYRRIAPPRRAAHYLFHIGHCGSTLLSRMLGEVDGVLSLREPPPLLELAQQRRKLQAGADDRGWRDAFDLTAHLLSRTFDTRDVSLVKPNSHANNLLTELMTWHPRSRAILLYVDLETYLATMLRPPARRETARAVEESRLADFRQRTADSGLRRNALDDARRAALVWLVQMREFVDVLESPGLSARARPVEFGAFLCAGRTALADVAAFLGRAAEAAALDRAFEPALAGQYSKRPGRAFDAAARAGMLESARRAHAVEIASGMEWAAAICGRYPAFRPLAAGTLPRAWPEAAGPGQTPE